MKKVTDKSIKQESELTSSGPIGRSRWVGAAIVAVLFYWLADAVLDSVAFNTGSFRDQFLSIDGHELLMRSIVAVMIVSFGHFVERNLHKQRCMQEVLERQNKKLEEREAIRSVELSLRKQAEEMLLDNERQLNRALLLARVGSWQMDLCDNTIRISPSMAEIYGIDKVRITVEESLERVHSEDREKVRLGLQQSIQGESCPMEYRICQSSGQILNLFSPAAYLVTNPEGKPLKLVGITQDLTERKQAEREAAIAGQIMEAKHSALRDTNVALKSVVRQIGMEKSLIKDQVRANVDRLVMPALRNLRRKVGAPAIEYVDLLDSNLKDVTSPFVNRLESDFAKLSPGEIEICDLIRKGLSSKDIAEIRNVSVQTISMQRKRIRKKLGIAHQGTSLPALLKSLTR